MPALDAIADWPVPTAAAAVIGPSGVLSEHGDVAHRFGRASVTKPLVDIKASSNLEDNIGVPLAAYNYAVSTMHCMSVSLGLDGAGLGTVWGRELATAMLSDAGFTEVEVNEIESDPLNYYYTARK